MQRCGARGEQKPGSRAASTPVSARPRWEATFDKNDLHHSQEPGKGPSRGIDKEVHVAEKKTQERRTGYPHTCGGPAGAGVWVTSEGRTASEEGANETASHNTTGNTEQGRAYVIGERSLEKKEKSRRNVMKRNKDSKQSPEKPAFNGQYTAQKSRHENSEGQSNRAPDGRGSEIESRVVIFQFKEANRKSGR